MYHGTDITRLPPHKIAALGVTRTFQNLRLFNNLSVMENVLIGQHARLHEGTFASVLQNADRAAAKRRGAVGWARDVLGLFGNRLMPRLDHVVSSLSYANRRRVEISRALAARPRLLLLDEPAAGMNPAETLELMDQIRSLKDLGVTVLLVEHKMELVNTISDRVDRPRLRQEDRRGQPGRDPGRSAGDRGVSRKATQACLSRSSKSRTCIPTTGRFTS